MSDREELKAKLRENFAGKIVRKDLTKKIGYISKMVNIF